MRLADESRGLGYPDRLYLWDLPSLERRRIDHDPIFFTISRRVMSIRNLYSTEDIVMMFVQAVASKSITGALEQKLAKPCTKSHTSPSSFFVCTVDPWNSLPMSTRHQDTIWSFRRLVGTGRRLPNADWSLNFMPCLFWVNVFFLTFSFFFTLSSPIVLYITSYFTSHD